MSEPNFDMLWEIHDSPYLSGKKSAFMTYGDFDGEDKPYWYDDDDDEPEDEPDDIEVEYTDANGQQWYVYLTATQKAQLDEISNPEKRLEFLESL